MTEHSSNPAPRGSCPACGYLVRVGICPECGGLVTDQSIIYDTAQATLLALEQESLLSAPASLPSRLAAYVKALLHPSRIPTTAIRSRRPFASFALLTTSMLCIAMVHHVQEFAHPLWTLMQAWRRPTFCLAVAMLVLGGGVLLLKRRNRQCRRRYWRAMRYGITIFAVLHVSWIAFLSSSLLVLPVQFSPFAPTTSDSSTALDAIAYGALLVAILNPLVCIGILPIASLRVADEATRPK